MKFINFFSAVSLFLTLVIPGCTKKLETGNTVLSVQDSTVSEETVRTPFGLMAKSNVHFLDSGYHLSYVGNHLVRIHTKTGQMIEDFGIQRPIKNKSIPGNLNNNGNVISTGNAAGGTNGPNVPGLGSGWITYAQNDVAVPTIQFTTEWTVPTIPPAYDGQLLYIFNGLQDGLNGTSHILQPVLQYGPNGIFASGNYWVISNWYASCQGCQAFYGAPQTVTPGTDLVGRMSGGAASSGGGYNYTSEFYSILTNPAGRIHNYPQSNSVSVNNVPQLVFPFETMEAYGMQQYADYPSENVCQMKNAALLLTTGRSPVYATPNWIPFDVVTDVGQHTVVVSPSEVDLFFH